MHLNPHYPHYYANVLARRYYQSGRYEDALSEFQKAFQICKQSGMNLYFSHIYLAMTYSKLGREKEAHDHLQAVLEMNPKFNLKERRRVSLFKNKEDTDREIDALRNAGAPEHPP